MKTRKWTCPSSGLRRSLRPGSPGSYVVLYIVGNKYARNIVWNICIRIYEYMDIWMRIYIYIYICMNSYQPFAAVSQLWPFGGSRKLTPLDPLNMYLVNLVNVYGLETPVFFLKKDLNQEIFSASPKRTLIDEILELNRGNFFLCKIYCIFY